MPGRHALFGTISVALVATAAVLLLGAGRGRDAGSRAAMPSAVAAHSSATVYGRPGPAGAPPPSTSPQGLRAPARRFLAAFLRYEVGERPPRVERALAATSTAAFAAELSRSPTGVSVAGAPRAARISRLRLRTVAARPAVALVSGEARRRGGVEQFAFVFVRTRAGWRAGGPGE